MHRIFHKLLNIVYYVIGSAGEKGYYCANNQFQLEVNPAKLQHVC